MCYFVVEDTTSTGHVGVPLKVAHKIKRNHLLKQGHATIYLKGPKHTIVIMLQARQFSTKQKSTCCYYSLYHKKILNQITRNIKILMR